MGARGWRAWSALVLTSVACSPDQQTDPSPPHLSASVGAAAVTTVRVDANPDDGWAFNVQSESVTLAGFTTGVASIGSGSLHVAPISNAGVNATKFILAYLPGSTVLLSDLDGFSVDFLIDPAGTAFSANQFYVNLYTRLSGSTAFYDCRFDYVATGGSTLAWTTLAFTGVTSPTAVAARSGVTCPASYAGMPAGSTLHFVAVNLGDTSGNDEGVGGYFDNASVGVAGNTTVWDFEAPNWGACSVDDDVGTKTYTLLRDCITDQTLVLPDEYTLDGDGYTITAVDPAGGHFLGAVVRNGGATAHITDVTITASGLANICDEGNNRLRGILLEGAAGSVTNSTVGNVNQGPSGCQEGNAIEARNEPFEKGGTDVLVTISGNTVSGYIKNGITANGSVAATITNNTVTGSGAVGVPLAAQNGIQVGFGATAVVRDNTISGHNYTPRSYVACGLLLYQADGVKASANAYSANEKDLCNYGKGGGTFNPAP